MAIVLTLAGYQRRVSDFECDLRRRDTPRDSAELLMLAVTIDAEDKITVDRERDDK